MVDTPVGLIHLCHVAQKVTPTSVTPRDKPCQPC